MVSDFNAQKARDNLQNSEWTYELLLDKVLMVAEITSKVHETKFGFSVYKNDVYPALLDDVIKELEARGFKASVKLNENTEMIDITVSW